MNKNHDTAKPSNPTTTEPTGRVAGQASEHQDDDNRTRIVPPGQSFASLAKAATSTMPGGPMAPGGNEVRQLGRYRILELLGRGGMATVYKAHDPSIDRTLAIKFLHASLCEDEEVRKRFVREAQAAGMLIHPNIATIFDVGEIEGRPYIAMELLEGEPLNELMSAGTRFSVKEVLEIGIQLARALDYAHGKGVVHRDIKPANIIRSKTGNTIKVADFGIAHLESPEGAQRTRVGDIIGTPQYMSPEQAMGEKVDGRSDLFSVGIVLYQLITGQKPFEAETIVALMLKIAKENPPTIQKLRPEAPPALRRVIERCLAKQPDRRYQSGKELADALIKLIRDVASEGQERPRIVPLRVKWTLLMAAFVAVVMGITGTVVNQRQQSALREQVTDYGASLARFIATQSAVPALAEDWIAVEVFIQEVMRSQDFYGLTVVDRGGTVRASSNASTIGKTYQRPAGEPLPDRGGQVKVQRYEGDSGGVIGFEAPITFQNKEIGLISLGLPESPLSRVARLSIGLMIALVLATVAAVAAGTWILANWFSKPIRLLDESMREIAKGHLGHRIAERRKDEFGLLYESFDQMADALSDRWENRRSGGAAEQASSPPLLDAGPEAAKS